MYWGSRGGSRGQGVNRAREQGTGAQQKFSEWQKAYYSFISNTVYLSWL